ncbi:MAG TPA: phage tail protein [Bacteroidia bacterium]|nr:phage tail protein [Bacteroidia bacterium]
MAYSNDTPIGTIIPFAGYFYLPNTTFEQMKVLQPELSERDYNRGLQNATELAESGWMLCDGKPYRYTTNPADILFQLCRVLSQAWGGNEFEIGASFRVPDLRGVFLRGVTTFSSLDPDASSRTKIYPTDNFGEKGNQVGSFQGDDFKKHDHKFQAPITGEKVGYASDSSVRANFKESATLVNGGEETRPKNAYVHYLIKAAHQSLDLPQIFENNSIVE